MTVTRHLFAYGSLQSREVFHALCGGGVVGERVLLHGHARYRLRGASYPALVPQRGGLVEGVLYRNLAPWQWRRLDEFEGTLYRRCVVWVALPAGDKVRAYCYLLVPRYVARLQRGEWEFADFLRHHQRPLLATLRR